MSTVVVFCFVQIVLSRLLIVSSPQVPFALDQVTHSLPASLSPIIVPAYQLLSSQNVSIQSDDIVLDYTYNEPLSLSLQQFTENAVRMWPSIGSQQTGKSLLAYIHSFADYVKNLNFSDVTVVCDDFPQHLEAARVLRSEFSAVFGAEVVVISRSGNSAEITDVVGKVMKPSGKSVFAMFAEGVAARKLIEAVESKKMNKVGYAFICSDGFRHLSLNSSEWSPDGYFYVVNELTISAHSREHAESLLLQSVLTRIVTNSPALPANYALVNIRSGEVVAAVRSPAALKKSFPQFTFPGGSYAVPSNAKAAITMSVNYVFLDANGFQFPAARVAMRGAQIAFEEVNNRTDILPNFLARDATVALSGMNFNYSFTRQQVLSSRNSLGLAHIPTPLGISNVQTYNILKELNLTLPMVSNARSDVLADKGKFPYYIRTRTGNSYSAFVTLELLKYFRWKRFAVLYAKDKSDNEEMYLMLEKQAAVSQMNITNSESLRGIPPTLTSNSSRLSLNSSLSDIQLSTARIILIFHQDLLTVLDAMYDLGIRNQYLIIGNAGLASGLFQGEGPQYQRRRTVVKGSIQFFPRTFLGAVGLKVQRTLIARDGGNLYPNSCFNYDCAMLFLHAADYMVSQGIDYEDKDEIMKAMRGTHFKGCAGLIAIAENSNERAGEEFSILNVKYFASNDTISVQDAMYFNPFSVTLFKSVSQVMWPDDSPTVYTDTLVSNFDCPFSEGDARTFPQGFAVGVGASVGICTLAGCVAIVIWRKWWKIEHQVLLTKHEISADDVLQLLSVPIEFLQYSAVGPDPESLSPFIAALCSSSVFDVEKVIHFRGQYYWTVLYIAFGCVGVYTLICAVKLLKAEHRLEWLPAFSFLMIFANLALPVLSNVLFLPIISTLSKVFLCYKSVNGSFSGSYMNKDCYQYCWSGAHIPYVVSCACGLVLFIPLATFTKPLWQELQPTLHIKSQPFPLMVKSLVQVALILLDNSLKAEFPEAHFPLFLAVALSYCLLLLRYPLYNYARQLLLRLNLWHSLTMLLVVVYSSLVFAAHERPDMSFTCLMVFIGLCLLLALFGIIAQSTLPYFSSKLYRKKRDATHIINFAFSYGKRAQKYLESHNRLKQSSDVDNSVRRAPLGEVSSQVLE